MFYESRIDPPEVAGEWGRVASLFFAGQACEAYAHGLTLANHERPPNAETLLLWGDVLRAVGRETAFQKLVRRQSDRFVDCARLQLQHCRVLAMQGRLLEAYRRLAAVEQSFGGEDAPRIKSLGLSDLIAAVRAATLAQMHRFSAAEEALVVLDKRVGEAREVHPWVVYERAVALQYMRRWSDSLSAYEEVNRLCPRWMRPAVMAHRCRAVLAMDRGCDADGGGFVDLMDPGSDLPEDISIDLIRLAELSLQERWDDLADAAQAHRNRWPDESDLDASVAGVGVRALWRAGRFTEARDLLSRLEDTPLAPALTAMATASEKAARHRLPVRGLVQEPYMCVATSVAMVLLHYGLEADPVTIHARMGGGEGKGSWQLDLWLAEQGLQVCDVKLEVEAIRQVLHLGAPLLATRRGPVGAHMVLIVGYDDAFSELELLDPDDGMPVFLHYEGVPGTMGVLSDDLLAVFPPEQPPPAEAAWRDEETSARREASDAFFRGDMDEALSRLRALSPDGRHMRQLCLEVPDAMLPESDRPGLLEQIVGDEQADPATRFAAAMSLVDPERDEETLQSVRTLLRQGHPILRILYRLRRDQTRGAWDDMERRSRWLLERAGDAEEFWYLHSVALDAQGRHRESESARRACLEIAPHHLAANIDALEHQGLRVPHAQRLGQLQSLQAHHPRAMELRLLIVQTLADLARVDDAEAALKEALRIAPYSELMRTAYGSWLLSMDREDLAEVLPGVPESLVRLTPPACGEDAEAEDRGAKGESPSESQAAEPELETLSREALLLRAEQELSQANETPRAALERLVQLQQQGRLRPFEDLAVHRLRFLDALVHRPSASAQELAALLPPTLPSPPSVAQDRFFVDLPLDRVTPALARAMMAWMDETMAEAEWTAEARFNRAILEELSGRIVAAVATYEKLQETSIRDAVCFRMGQICLQQERVNQAQEHFQASVDATPGHVSSWLGLANCGAQSGSEELVRRAHDRLLSLRPYDIAVATMILEYRVERDGASVVEPWLSEHGQRFPVAFRTQWRLEALLRQERWAEALAAIDQDHREAAPRDALAVEVAAKLNLGGPLEVTPVLDRALEDHPEDLFFLLTKAELLEDGDAYQASQLYRRVLKLSPEPHALARLLNLSLIRGEHLVLQHITEDAKSDQRAELIRLCVGVVAQLGNMPLLYKYLQWAERKYPRDPAVLVPQVEVCLQMGDFVGAVRAGETLQRLDPENPEYLLAYASSIQHSSFDKAAPLLRKHFEITGDPGTLLQLASLYMTVGNGLEADKCYWQVLEAVPGHPVAVANLYLLFVKARRLLPHVMEALDNGVSADVQYFAVAAVQTALSVDKTLPEKWGDHAAERLQHMAEHGNEFEDERKVLRSMITVWARQRREHGRVMEAIPGRVARWWHVVFSRFRPWGRSTRWVAPVRALPKQLPPG